MRHMRDHVPALCDIAQDYNSLLCRIARDLHINSMRKKYRAMLHIAGSTHIQLFLRKFHNILEHQSRLYLRLFAEKKPKVKSLVTLSL
jgi:hypothetical protein